MKKLLFCLAILVIGFSANAQSSLKVGITGGLGITQQAYEQWIVYNPPIVENGIDYSAGLTVEKEIGKLFLRTGVTYQYTSFSDLDNQLPLYGFSLPSGFGFLSDPTLVEQTFHQIEIPVAIGFQFFRREKLKIGGLVKVSATTTISKRDTYSGYTVYSLIPASFVLEKGTADYNKNELNFRGINLQTGITLQHQIAPKYTLFWQPMISILEYRTKNDISQTTEQEHFYLSNNQFLSLQNFGLGFGILKTL